MADVQVSVSQAALADLQKDPDKLKVLKACADPETGFREFLNYWWFLDGESGKPRILGEHLWPGQEDYVANMATHPKIFALKARKLGFTTLSTAYDGWVLRFRKPNERVHLFSRRGDAANEIMRAVKYGLDRLPSWMQLPYSVNKQDEIRLIGGPDDERIAKAYPADEDTAVEATATHAHIDEWARMRNPRRVWQAIEPSLAGTAHIVTTGMGPANYSATFWMMCLAGDTDFLPFFVDALQRPDRNDAWLSGKRKGVTEKESRQEYPMTWKDSLYAGADLLFAGPDLDWVGSNGTGPQKALDGHKYVKAWDIGRHNDATVCVVWDETEEPVNMVHFLRIKGRTYPEIQAEIEHVHELYPGPTVIEDNAAGEAVRENLTLPHRQVEGHKTTGTSKPRMIRKMEAAVENHDVTWDAKAWPILHSEFEAYQLPDDNVVQDCVMAACIGYDFISSPQRRRRARVKVFMH